MIMRFIGGKTKVLTLSYDDGVVQDKRLIGIMDKYGLKGTFNISSGVYPSEESEKRTNRMKLSEAKALYTDCGHELAIHGYTHPFLGVLDSDEIIYEISEDRKALERDYGVIARGMAYPNGSYNDIVIDILDKCHIAYARTVIPTYKFDLPTNWLELKPTCHHNYEQLDELIRKFVETPARWPHLQMFYLWGHSYEFDSNDNWDVIERFAEYAGGRDDIWYATNIEIYDYVKAYERLQTSFDKRIIHNPSAVDVWIDIGGENYCVQAGATLKL